MSTFSVPRGLAGVVVTDTGLGDVRGTEGFYHYREYSAVDLAEHRSFEEVAHLLVEGHLPDRAELTAYRELEGHLPDRAELTAYRERIGTARVAPAALTEVLPVLVRGARSPLTALRTTWSWLGGHLDLPPGYDSTPQERADQALRLAALAPTVLAAAHRLAAGLDPVPADPGLGHTADYLRMVTGRDPDEEDVRALERYLVLTIDHGFSASTFTARTVASTGADPAAALVAALGSFSGPLHGGAPSRALEALDEIG